MYCKPGRSEFKDLRILRATGPDILTSCTSAKLLLALKKYSQDLLKTHSGMLAIKRHGYSYSCTVYAFVGEEDLSESCNVIL